MILFAADLDNTLIYSEKHRKRGDICIEWRDGAEQSFLPPEAVELLRELNRRCFFVPITTRSLEQYRRIRWPEGCEPAYAVTTNGAYLLRNGEIDGDWQEESAARFLPYRDALERKLSLFRQDTRCLRCRMVDERYAFAVCIDDAAAQSCARDYRDETPLTVCASGRKLYCFPPETDKGTAFLALRERLRAADTVCAGDSGIDLPMLRLARCAIVPADYPYPLPQDTDGTLCRADGGSFPLFVLRRVLSIADKNGNEAGGK